MAGVGDLLADGMNPIERVESQERVCSPGLSRSGDLDTALVADANPFGSKRRASQVAGKPFESVGFIVEDELAGMNGKA